MIEILFSPLWPGALLALLAAAPDSLPAPVRTLPPVDVRADRARLDARRRLPTADVTDLRADAAHRALPDVGGLLAATVGARVVQYGGLGAFSTISLRGADPGQVSVLLDGVPVTSAAHAVVNLADLPAAALDRIEVYRGTSPLAFGVATPGGAVNLVTRDDPRTRRVRVAAGSFGTRAAAATAGGARGPWTWLAHAGYEGATGDYPFVDDRGTPYNAADDAEVTRRNNRYDAASALVRAAWSPVARTRVALRAEGVRRAQGLPGLGAVQAPNPRLTLARGRLALEAAHAAGADRPGLTLRAHAGGERSRFRDTEGELGIGRQDGRTRAQDEGLAFEIASPDAWDVVALAAGASAREERALGAPPTLGQAVPPESRRTSRGAYATARATLAGGRLLMHYAVHHERQRDHLRATLVAGAPWSADVGRALETPQAGVRLELPRGFAARANAARTARAPEFGELFGDQGVVAPNPSLRPESGTTWDAGLLWHGERRGVRARAEWTHWAARTLDLIAYVPAAARTVRATNFSRVGLDGDELVAAAARAGVTLSGSFARTRARQDDPGNLYDGRRLPLRPERQAGARVDAARGPWRASADLLYLGEDFLDPINFRRLPPRTLVGASLSRAFGPLRWTLEGRNLGDRRVQDVAGYPLPGRSVFVACEARFEPPEAP